MYDGNYNVHDDYDDYDFGNGHDTDDDDDDVYDVEYADSNNHDGNVQL